jgi:hypothetical protein
LLWRPPRPPNTITKFFLLGANYVHTNQESP